MKNYFSHDHHARSDKKILPLLMKMGWEGYGLYWALIEMLYEEGGYIMQTHCESIAFALRVDCSVINSLINDFSLFVIEEGKITSDSVLRRLDLIKQKSTTASKSAQLSWEKRRNTNALQTECKRNAIKENKIKENIVVVNVPFEQFWEVYGKKRDKAECIKVWQSLTDGERLDIMAHIPKYKTYQPEEKFRKDPIRYLKKKSWMDEMPTTTEQEPQKVKLKF